MANFQPPAIANPDLDSCLHNVLLQTLPSLQGVVDSQGNQVSNITQAVGITYERCVTTCGSGPQPFDWHGFSTLFTAWFLPCLALISQLPYGANDTLDNFEAMALTVGSPMLAAYSLALSVTSNRSIVKRFRRSNHPNSQMATQIVASLQHVSFGLPREEHVLPSLIALQQNDLWWRRLDDGLNSVGSRWTLAAIMSMVYVALAYVLTWVDRIESQLQGPNDCQWQSAATLWISLLPIVICYLQLSPRSDLKRISRALEYANQCFYVATETNQVERRVGSRTIVLESDSCRDTVREDELCTTPICFYARVFPWLQAARKIADAFDAASQSASNNATPPSSRSETIQYCTLHHDHAGTDPSDLFDIFTVSVIAALFLQWGITGPAIAVEYFTPTKGLDCLSGSLLLYGCAATVVWMLCVLSSALARSYTTSSHGLSRKVAGWLAIITRLLAKTLAVVNAFYIILLSLLQFSNVYDSCYCRSSFPGFGNNKAYIKLKYSEDDNRLVNLYWIGGMIMVSLVSLLFIIAINLLKRRPEPRVGSLEQAYEEYVMVNLR